MADENKTHCRLIDVEVDNRLNVRDARLSQGLEEHLASCRRCNLLYGSLTTETPAADVSREAEHRIVRMINTTLTPVSRLPSTPTLLIQVFALFVVSAVVVLRRMKMVGLNAMTRPQLIGTTSFLLIGLLITSQSLLAQIKPGSLHRISASKTLGFLGIGFASVILMLFPFTASAEFIPRSLRCLGTGLSLAVPASLVLTYVLRRGAPMNLRSAGATAGAIGGWLGLTVLQYSCDLQNAGHLLLGHGGVVLVSALAGFTVGEFVSRAQQHPRF